MLDVLGIKNANKLVKLPEDQVPEDPVSENANILMMKPVKAFLYQDHPAHIQVHMAAMKDPKIMQLVGQNPQAQTMQAAMMAHINEHIAYEYRKQMEMQMGIELPFHPDETDQSERQMPEMLEVAISQKQLWLRNSYCNATPKSNKLNRRNKHARSDYSDAATRTADQADGS
jgi:hypothetical protein